MKRLTVLLLALTIPVIIVAAPLLWAYKPGLPTAGRDVLDFYLHETNLENGDLEIMQAKNPGAFKPAISAAAYGDGSYFIMSHNSTQRAHNQNVRPLPYPPTELWCVQLGEGANQQLVMVALHQDLYKATWAVHDLLLSDTAVDNLLRQVRCQEK